MNRKIQISVHILHKAALTWTASTLQDHSFVVGWVNLFVEFIKLWFQLDYNSTQQKKKKKKKKNNKI